MTISRVSQRVLGLGALLLPFAAAAALRPPGASAADHIDGPSAQIDPAADISDVFAWMSADASRLNLIANVFYSAGPTSAFSPAVQYAFHIESGTEYGAVSDEATVICQFYDTDRIECWAGDEYVEGDPSDPAGITSSSGRLRVFAGRERRHQNELFGVAVALFEHDALAGIVNADHVERLELAQVDQLRLQMVKVDRFGIAVMPNQAIDILARDMPGHVQHQRLHAEVHRDARDQRKCQADHRQPSRNRLLQARSIGHPTCPMLYPAGALPVRSPAAGGTGFG